jgi:uncharacterized repeat protein (TIGR01451 family)
MSRGHVCRTGNASSALRRRLRVVESEEIREQRRIRVATCVSVFTAVLCVLITCFGARQVRADDGCTPWESARPIPGLGYPNAVISGNGLVVGVGGKATFWTTQDGTGWSPHQLDGSASFTSAVWDGTRFLAVGSGGIVATSSDGGSWSIRPRILGDNFIRTVVWTGTQFVALAWVGTTFRTTVLRSADGLRWTQQTLEGIQLWSLAWNGSLVVAVGENTNTGVVLTSDDGATWVQRGVIGQQLFEVIWTGSRFVAVGHLAVASSPDGVIWKQEAGPRMDWGEHVAYSGSRFLVSGREGLSHSPVMFTSPDLSSWTSVTPPNYSQVASMIWAFDRFIAVLSYGDVYTSEDGNAWSLVLTAPSAAASDVLWDGARFVAVGGKGFTATSPDGVAWAPSIVSGQPSFNSVAWNGTMYGAVGWHTLFSSPDGVAWSPCELPVPDASLHDIAWNGSTFLATGDTVFTSANGIDWTVPDTVGFNAFTRGLAWHGSKWVAVVWGGTALTSPDGVTWSSFTIAPGPPLEGLTTNGSTLVAVGSGVYTSPDGETWTERPAPTPWELQDVAFDSRGAFAVGEMSTIMESPDGLDWYYPPIQIGSAFYGAAASPTARVAVGTTFAWQTCGASADLAVSLGADNTVLRPGDPITFTVTLGNVGPLAVASPVVAVSLPPGLGYVSDDGAGTFVAATGLWSPGAVAAGESRVLHLAATAIMEGDAIPLAELTASDQPDPDSTPGNHDPAEDDEASVLIAISCGPMPAPALTVPDSVASGTPLLLSWTSTSLDDSYEIQESTNPDFSEPVTTVITGTSWSVTHVVDGVTVFHYRVRGTYACGTSTFVTDWSLPRKTSVYPPGSKFYPVTPCRVVDTRSSLDPASVKRGDFNDDEVRAYTLSESVECPRLPSSVAAWSLNLQFRPMSQAAYLMAFPDGVTQPSVSTLVASPDRWRVNNAIVPAGTNGTFDVYCQYAGRVIIDVNGYFAP